MASRAAGLGDGPLPSAHVSEAKPRRDLLRWCLGEAFETLAGEAWEIEALLEVRGGWEGAAAGTGTTMGAGARTGARTGAGAAAGLALGGPCAASYPRMRMMKCS